MIRGCSPTARYARTAGMALFVVLSAGCSYGSIAVNDQVNHRIAFTNDKKVTVCDADGVTNCSKSDPGFKAVDAEWVQSNVWFVGKGKVWKDPKLDRVLANYALAKQMFEADGRRIINATPGGNLNVFDRVPFEELFGR